MEGYRAWWRVTRPSDGHVTWTPEDPSDRLVAAWEGATVEGPFVHADDHRGAVDALDRLFDMMLVAEEKDENEAGRAAIREAKAIVNRERGR